MATVLIIDVRIYELSQTGKINRDSEDFVKENGCRGIEEFLKRQKDVGKRDFVLTVNSYIWALTRTKKPRPGREMPGLYSTTGSMRL